MDQSAGDCQNCSSSSVQGAANSHPLMGVCDECCIDGSLLSTDNDHMPSHTVLRNGAASDQHEPRAVDDKCDDMCSNIADPDVADVPPALCNLDSTKPDSASADVDISSVVHFRSSSNDSADVSAAEKVAVEGEEKCSNEAVSDDVPNSTEVDEPLITAVDVYKGLRLADGWNPAKMVHRREVGSGRTPPAQFACQASASIALVRRLALYSKLDAHTGCVNALHFNDSGN